MAAEKVTISQIRKLLSDPKDRMNLHKLVHDETERIHTCVEGMAVQAGDVEGTAKKALKDFDSASEDLELIIAYGSYFGSSEQSYLWTGALNRLGMAPHGAGSTFLLRLQYYPALLVLYAGGIAAVASKNSDSLKALFDTQTTSPAREPRDLVLDANCTMLEDAGNRLLGYERKKTPLSDYLNAHFGDTLPKELTFGQEFDQVFDEWEILVGMVVADTLSNKFSRGGWAPVGRFAWRESYSGGTALKRLRRDLDRDSPEWFALKAGLFGGVAERAREALSVVEKISDRVSFF